MLRWYEWDILVFCEQTSFYLAIIGTLRTLRKPSLWEKEKMLLIKELQESII